MATEVTDRRSNGESPQRHHSLNPSDRRDFIPPLGLKEYWYPAIQAKRVSASKPRYLKMLGEDLVLFRGTDGKVAALTNVCPHRGGFLAKGDCHYPGTVACPYHGFVFDEKGECLAALGEGPDSKMPGKIHARVYPTVTLQGLVYVWMGEGEPAEMGEDIPEEFFDDKGVLMYWSTEWPCNWRPALENLNDAHVRYVHRDSLMFLMRPLGGSTKWTRPVVLGPSLQRAYDGGGARTSREAEDSQDYYPAVKGHWPKHKWRSYWTWAFAWAGKRAYKRSVNFKNPEGRAGHHLPSLTRVYYGTHMYTRLCVPVEENKTRVWYYHYAQPKNMLGRVWEKAWFTLVHNWLMNTNFSSQDYSVIAPQYYDQPEKLSVSDLETIEWRKLVMKARGMNHALGEVEAPWEAESIAEEELINQSAAAAEPAAPTATTS